MSEGQVVALFLCFVIGWCGTFVLIGEDHKPYRKYSLAWVAFWCGPPLVLLWVKGVFG